MEETDFDTKQSESEQDVIAFYDGYAKSWDDRFGQSYSTEYFLERRWKSFELVCSESNVVFGSGLELGVGTGVYIVRESQLFDKLIAVDGSENMLGELRKKLSFFNISNVETIQANVIAIDQVKSSSIDCIFFFGLIEHIVDITSFLKELKRVLKVDGVVIGVTPNGKSPWYKLRAMVRGTGKHCSSDNYYTLSELNKYFKCAGFQVVSSLYWGAVPAGVSYATAKILSMFEPLIEKSPFKSYLGGLTFSFTKAPEK